MPQIVEFVGLPGAGKTTIVNLLCAAPTGPYARGGGDEIIRFSKSVNGWGDQEKRLKRSLLKVMKIMLSLGWIVLYPGLFQRVVHYTVCMSRQPRLLALARLRQFYCCLSHLTWIKIYRRFFSVPTEYILLDQGVLQAILSLDLEGRHLPVEVLKDITLPDMVVFIDVDAAVASQRVFARPTHTSRLDRMHMQTAQGLMIELEEVFHGFSTAVQALMPSDVILIQSQRDDAPEDVARAIARKLSPGECPFAR